MSAPRTYYRVMNENLWIRKLVENSKVDFEIHLQETRQSSAIGAPGYQACRYRANMTHVRQSRSDSGLGFQVKVFDTFKLLV